jgi:hypothetical protein
MAINFFCSTCGAQIAGPSYLAGKWMKCAACNAQTLVPAHLPPSPKPALVLSISAPPPYFSGVVLPALAPLIDFLKRKRFLRDPIIIGCVAVNALILLPFLGLLAYRGTRGPSDQAPARKLAQPFAPYRITMGKLSADQIAEWKEKNAEAAAARAPLADLSESPEHPTPGDAPDARNDSPSASQKTAPDSTPSLDGALAERERRGTIAPSPQRVDRPSTSSSLGTTPTGIPLHMGPRGGIYHYSKSGKKVYERRRR